MQALDPIEAALARLMPPALSQSCQLDIEAMFDELAGTVADDEVVQMVRRPHPYKWIIGSGIAAAVAALAAIFPLMTHQSRPAVTAIPAFGDSSALVLVGESDRVESMTDEGWQENSDGSAMHAVRLNVVEENSLRDEETGIVMQVSEPREEILLMPVSAF